MQWGQHLGIPADSVRWPCLTACSLPAIRAGAQGDLGMGDGWGWFASVSRGPEGRRLGFAGPKVPVEMRLICGPGVRVAEDTLAGGRGCVVCTLKLGSDVWALYNMHESW